MKRLTRQSRILTSVIYGATFTVYLPLYMYRLNNKNMHAILHSTVEDPVLLSKMSRTDALTDKKADMGVLNANSHVTKHLNSILQTSNSSS